MGLLDEATSHQVQFLEFSAWTETEICILKEKNTTKANLDVWVVPVAFHLVRVHHIKQTKTSSFLDVFVMDIAKYLVLRH